MKTSRWRTKMKSQMRTKTTTTSHKKSRLSSRALWPKTFYSVLWASMATTWWFMTQSPSFLNIRSTPNMCLCPSSSQKTAERSFWSHKTWNCNSSSCPNLRVSFWGKLRRCIVAQSTQSTWAQMADSCSLAAKTTLLKFGTMTRLKSQFRITSKLSLVTPTR